MPEPAPAPPLWTSLGRRLNQPVAKGLGVTFLVLGLALFIGTCLGVRQRIGTPVDFGDRDGDEIVVCGVAYDIGTPVVLWSDPDGYDAYSEVPRFAEPERDARGAPVTKRRYGARDELPDDVAASVATEGWTRDSLARVCRQFVLHYDVAGTSKQCFRILQDMRNLSVHFLLDVDGTIYQTLDLQERAWHGGVANSRS